jgi:hypothetical protein
VTIYHNTLIVRTAKTRSGRFEREDDENPGLPGKNPPETHREILAGMNGYAHNCMAICLAQNG